MGFRTQDILSCFVDLFRKKCSICHVLLASLDEFSLNSSLKAHPAICLLSFRDLLVARWDELKLSGLLARVIHFSFLGLYIK